MKLACRSIVIFTRSKEHFLGSLAPISKQGLTTVTSTPFVGYAQSQAREIPKMENRRIDKFMFVGLGNHNLPSTRHNVGMQIVDEMAGRLQTSFAREKECSGCVAKASVDGIEIILLKPRMPMNVNGTSVAKTARFYGITSQNVYLLHDDIDTKTGQLSLKEKGSANGHNGVRSVIHSLHSDVIPRIKIGIDRPTHKDMVGDYVLARFPATEQLLINVAIEKSLGKISEHLSRRMGSDLRYLFQESTEKQGASSGSA